MKQIGNCFTGCTKEVADTQLAAGIQVFFLCVCKHIRVGHLFTFITYIHPLYSNAAIQLTGMDAIWWYQAFWPWKWLAPRPGFSRRRCHSPYSASAVTNEWIKTYTLRIKTSAQNLARSQCQIHTVHTCRFSQVKTTKRHWCQYNANSPYPPRPLLA